MAAEANATAGWSEAGFRFLTVLEARNLSLRAPGDHFFRKLLARKLPCGEGVLPGLAGIRQRGRAYFYDKIKSHNRPQDVISSNLDQENSREASLPGLTLLGHTPVSY